MIDGAHVIVYSRDPAADRAFLRDVVGFGHVDAGDGWLVFALPPAELAVHPAETNDAHELYFMCADIRAEMAALESRGARCEELRVASWGMFTRIPLPGGGSVGLYQPRHATAVARSGA